MVGIFLDRQAGKNRIWFLSNLKFLKGKSLKNYNLKYYKIGIESIRTFAYKVIYFSAFKNIICLFQIKGGKPMLRFLIDNSLKLSSFPNNYKFEVKILFIEYIINLFFWRKYFCDYEN